MEYIIQAQLEVEVSADSKKAAVEQATATFEKIQKAGAKISNAKVVDKATGFFI